MSPAALREHQRILAAYGGVYNDPKLQGVIEQTVERLVAASERPDLHYKVTMLNSQSINAFALPTGQLYVTRGLVALANDEFELASVLAHEMGHVIARHAAIREEQAKQAALVGRVVSDVISDPEVGALALAKSKLALASFSRAQEFEADAIGIGIAARAGYDPYGAVRFLTSMQHNSELKPQQSGAIDPRAPDFLSSHPATPERITNALANARQYSGPKPQPPLPPSAATRRPISPASMASYSARIRARGLYAAGAFCIRGSASPLPRRMASLWKIPRRPCSASSMAAARRCGSTSCACPRSRRWPVT